MSYRLNELFSVNGKTAIVTGGSRGIGKMIAQGYVDNGVRTYISARKANVCLETAEELSKNGECIAIPADLSTSDGRSFFIKTITERENKIDVLVNNAGVSYRKIFRMSVDFYRDFTHISENHKVIQTITIC